ncbi:MAG TPA: hypothetical protein DEQ87_14870 [Algoriphagus sp.]|nr:hypothetical protein [Algoriphagus sp.]MAN88124.1 hypothetical protein [Algoriphagus sp.]HAD50860.1 hypothetical protein [Algoriphagus sp.]HAH38701.1 hypothetical protein [Algoriphagus sp.]HAS56986.1 hypothetical protein [Algoriphagus sp.]
MLLEFLKKWKQINRTLKRIKNKNGKQFFNYLPFHNSEIVIPELCQATVTNYHQLPGSKF